MLKINHFYWVWHLFILLLVDTFVFHSVIKAVLNLPSLPVLYSFKMDHILNLHFWEFSPKAYDLGALEHRLFSAWGLSSWVLYCGLNPRVLYHSAPSHLLNFFILRQDLSYWDWPSTCSLPASTSRVTCQGPGGLSSLNKGMVASRVASSLVPLWSMSRKWVPPQRWRTCDSVKECWAPGGLWVNVLSVVCSFSRRLAQYSGLAANPCLNSQSSWQLPVGCRAQLCCLFCMLFFSYTDFKD